MWRVVLVVVLRSARQSTAADVPILLVSMAALKYHTRLSLRLPGKAHHPRFGHATKASCLQVLVRAESMMGIQGSQVIQV